MQWSLKNIRSPENIKHIFSTMMIMLIKIQHKLPSLRMFTGLSAAVLTFLIVFVFDIMSKGLSTIRMFQHLLFYPISSIKYLFLLEKRHTIIITFKKILNE